MFRNERSKEARRSWANGGYGEYQSKREMKEAIAKGISCAICGDPAEVPDHCHKTRKWRLPLCALCNSGLGFFDDNPGLLRSAADYLERFTISYRVTDEDNTNYIGDPFG